MCVNVFIEPWLLCKLCTLEMNPNTVICWHKCFHVSQYCWIWPSPWQWVSLEPCFWTSIYSNRRKILLELQNVFVWKSNMATWHKIQVSSFVWVSVLQQQRNACDHMRTLLLCSVLCVAVQKCFCPFLQKVHPIFPLLSLCARRRISWRSVLPHIRLDLLLCGSKSVVRFVNCELRVTVWFTDFVYMCVNFDQFCKCICSLNFFAFCQSF